MSMPNRRPGDNPCVPAVHSFFPNREAAQAWCDERKRIANIASYPIRCPRCNGWRTFRVP